MGNDGADFGIQFSTDLVPARERLPYFREAFSRSIVRLDLGPYGDRPLRWAATLHEFDGLCVISGRTNGHICRRTQALLPMAMTIIFLRPICRASACHPRLAESFGWKQVLRYCCPVLMSVPKISPAGRISDIAHPAPTAQRDSGQAGRHARAADTGEHRSTARLGRLCSADSEKPTSGIAGIAAALYSSYP